MNRLTLLAGLCDKVTSQTAKEGRWIYVTTEMFPLPHVRWLCLAAIWPPPSMSIIVSISVCSVAYKKWSKGESSYCRTKDAERYKGVKRHPHPRPLPLQKKWVVVEEEWQRTDFRVELFASNEIHRIITLPCWYVGRPIQYISIFWPLLYTLHAKALQFITL